MPATNNIAKNLISVMRPSASKLSAHIMFKIFLVKYVDILIFFGMPVFHSSTKHTFHVCRYNFLSCVTDKQDRNHDQATKIGHYRSPPVPLRCTGRQTPVASYSHLSSPRSSVCREVENKIFIAYNGACGFRKICFLMTRCAVLPWRFMMVEVSYPCVDPRVFVLSGVVACVDV